MIPTCAELWRQVSAYVLAGGRSSRMGQDKAFVRVEGVELVERAVRVFGGLCERVAILSGPPNPEREALLERYARTVSDAGGEHQGPLAGIIAALQHATTPLLVILAVDQPGITAGALELLLNAMQDPGLVAACFVSEGRAEPLPLVIRRELLDAIVQQSAAGEWRLITAVAQAAAAAGKEFSGIECLELPPDTLRMANLNTPGDLNEWDRDALASNHSALPASE